MNNADGSFGGYTVVGMDPQYFSRFYDEFNLGPDSVLTLIGRDGVIRARRSNDAARDDVVGQDMSSSHLFSAQLKPAGHGKFRATSPIDGVKRHYNYRSIKAFPLIVLVGTSEAAALVGFEERKNLYLWTAGVASIVIVAFAMVMLRQISRAARVTGELRRSEERYAHVERGTNDGIWDRNLQSGEAYLSPRGKEMLGYEEGELQVEEAGFFRRLHPEDEARVSSALEQAKREGTPYRIEYRLLHKDGGYRWILSRGKVVRNETGEPARMVGSITDITEHKEAIIAMERSEKRLRQLLDEMLEGYAIIGFDWTYLYVNDAAARHAHKRRAELTGRTMLELYPDIERSEIFAAFRRVMEQRAPERLEVSFNFPDGAIGWYEISVQPVPEGIFVLSLDTTERKNSARHIEEQARLLDRIFRYSLDSIVLLDKDYNFIRVSESYAKACQREVSAFSGRNHFDLYPSELKQELEPFRREKKIYSRSARPFVFPEHPEWGTTYWDLGLVPILDQSGEIELFLFTLKDVTVQVRADEQSLDYIAQLKALSARMLTVQEEERRAVARELHDEIGQGLTAVKIHLQAMEQACQGCGRSFSTENLLQALLTTGTILEQVRNLSLNLRPMQLDDLGLPVALRSLVQRDAATAGWIAHIDEDFSGERLDSNLELACYRVAQEALTNVMRHAAASEIWVTVRQSDEGLLLTVRDNGRGFEPGIDRSAAGAPHLGLLGMEERVRNLAGQLKIRTSRGEGTEVQAIFPLAPAAVDLAAPA
ncbi:MAG: hypothetical protein A3H91_10355 [Gammaproteobacteria bacterium RIFCSPLOWO2_02_FULL_61_13]|nr:MAG: hypothetical protein A3H91_10355 [Gammaproteobacteria bacterium RIFCSPLOWO2_02_FULL_61_13]